MKKLIPSLALFLAVVAANAQTSSRLVLLEHFTNAGCGPCALYNPEVQQILDNNTDKIVAIKYQWDYPGTDPMNLHNPGEVQTRFNYYVSGNQGVPHSQIDGNVFGGHPADWNVGTVNTRQAVSSPITINAEAELLPGFEEMSVDVNIEALEDLPSNLRVHIVVVEEHIHFDSAPGSNGETDFYNVMKKMLPNASGTSVPSLMAGETFDLSQSWTMANVYDFFTLGAVVFVQNNSTKEVLQAAFVKPTATPDLALDAATFSVKNVASSVCNGTVVPVVNIRNYGGDELYTVGISYSLNGVTSANYVWEGSLPFFQDIDIELPPLTDVSLNSTNTLTVSTFSPNGAVDQNMANDGESLNFYFNTTAYNNAPVVTELSQLTLNITTDNYPEETSWKIRNSTNEIIASGGPYAGQVTTYTEYIDLPAGSDCYQFTMFDTFGDGICCDYGNGSYTLTDAGGTVLVSGGNFGREDVSPIIAEGCEEAPFNETIVHANDGYPSGSISINLTGFDGPYDLQWSNGATSSYVGELVGGEYTVTITDGGGCQTVRTFTVNDDITGIDNDPNAPALVQNHPNPCNDFTNIQLLRVAEAMRLSVVDIAGKVVFEQTITPGTQNVQLNTAQLANGTYFYQLSDASKMLGTKKMVVIH